LPDRQAPRPGMEDRDGHSKDNRMLRMGKDEKETIAATGTPLRTQMDHILDLRGLIVPLTLLKILQGFRAIGSGETLEIIGTDTDTRRDVMSVLKTSPCKVLGIRDEKDRYIIRLMKNAE